MSRQVRNWVLLSLVLAVLPPLAAQDARWVQTSSWQGTGSRQTEVFFVTASHWRVVYRAKGKGPFRMVLHREGGSDPVVVSNQQGPPLYSGRRSFRQPGRRYLEITSANTAWEVAVEQLLTPLDEWRLVKLIKKDQPELVRIATWTGGPGEEEFEVRVPRGSWKLFANVEGAGKLDVSVTAIGGEPAEVVEMKQLPAGETGSWVHHSGDFRIRATAGESCRWKLDVCIAK